MNLSDLFVSYNQVKPIAPRIIKDDYQSTLYPNLNRVKKVTEDPQEDEEPTETSETSDTSTWEVKSTSEVSPAEVKKTSGRTPTAKLNEYQKSAGYKHFQSELDKFVKNNAQYAHLKDSLNYLAALESSYNMEANNSKSNALGWFQFLDDTRSKYNTQSREEFARDAQSQLLTAAKHYTALQEGIKARGGDHNDFVTMYGAWWRPASAYAYINNSDYDYTTKHNERFSDIRRRASEIVA